MPLRTSQTTILLILALLFTLMVSSGCVELKTAYIPPELLQPGWEEATDLRNTGIEFLSLEKWSSITYTFQINTQASLTITTINSLILTDEKELIKYANTSIQKTFSQHYTLNIEKQGSRELAMKHTSKYVVYIAQNNTINKTIGIIGEVWNCGISGISVICLGYSYIDTNTINPYQNTSTWNAIIGDPLGTIDNNYKDDGLIYSIRCH